MCEKAEDELARTEQQLKKAQAEIEDLKAQICAMHLLNFEFQRFAVDDASIKFYTGFPSYQHFISFFEFVKPSAETMIYCYAHNIPSVSRPGSKKMLLIDELFMFLVRIRLGLSS